jgi:hypothetical protein
MYDENQWRLIARELARAGRHIPSAMAALRRDYECFRKLSETTVRKLLKNEALPCMLSEQQSNLAFAQESTERAAERARLRAEAARNNPLAQVLADVIHELRDLAKANHDPKTYHVLCNCLKLMHSLEIRAPAKEPEDADR